MPTNIIADACSYYFDAWQPLLTAMVRQEGGPAAFVKAVKCSYPSTLNFEMAVARACKTIRNIVVENEQNPTLSPDARLEVLSMRPRGPAPNLDPWTNEASPRRLVITDSFIERLGRHWAPVGSSTDRACHCNTPGWIGMDHTLNQHWVPNVKALYQALTT